MNGPPVIALHRRTWFRRVLVGVVGAGVAIAAIPVVTVTRAHADPEQCCNGGECKGAVQCVSSSDASAANSEGGKQAEGHHSSAAGNEADSGR